MVKVSMKAVHIVLFIFLNTINALSNVAEVYDARSFGLIQSTPYPHFVMFYAPWCPHCSKVLTIWDKLAEINHQQRRMKIAKVDCSESTPLCASEKIKAYPTFRLFDKYRSFTYRDKKRTVKDFSQFIEQNLPNLPNGQIPDDETGNGGSHASSSQQPIADDGLMVLTEDTFEKEVGRRVAFVDFFAPWCSHCRKLEPVWKQLAERFAHEPRVVIAKIDCTAEPNLCRQKAINAYPTLRLYKDGGLKVIDYDNERSLSALTEFVNQNIQESTVRRIVTGTVKWFDRFQIIETLVNHPLCIYMHTPWQDSSVKMIPEFQEFSETLATNADHVVEAVLFDCTIDAQFCKKFETSENHSPIIVYFRSLHDYVIYGESEIVSVDGLMHFVEQASVFVDETINKDEL